MFFKFFSLVLIVSLFFISCRKEATTWDSNWVFPIVNDTLDINNLVNDSTLEINNSGYFELNLHRSLLDLRLLDIIEIPDTTLKENFAISLLNLSVPPGYNFVNSTEEHDFNVKDIELKRVILASGKIEITLKNPLPTKAFFNLKLPGVSLNNQEFEKNYIAPAGSISNPGIVTEVIDIAGYTLDLTGVTGGSFNKIQSQVTVQTDPAGPAINMTNKDTTRFTAKFQDFELNYARGYFGNQVISDTTVFDFLPLSHVLSGNIDLPSTSVSFDISNGMKIDASGCLNYLRNENLNSGEIVSLTHPSIGNPFNVAGATGTWDNLNPGLKLLSFNSMNSNVEAFIENIGVKQHVSYTLQLNPWGNVSGGWNEIFSTSRLKVGLNIQMPLSIGANDLTVADTFDFALEQDFTKTHIKSGSFDLKYKNAFPFKANVCLVLLDENGNELGTVTASSPIESSLSSSVSPSETIHEKMGQTQFLLSDDIVLKLNKTKKIVIKAVFSTPNSATGLNEQVLIPGDAYLGLLLKTCFKLENRIGND
jgi:hypothetical protein